MHFYISNIDFRDESALFVLSQYGNSTHLLQMAFRRQGDLFHPQYSWLLITAMEYRVYTHRGRHRPWYPELSCKNKDSTRTRLGRIVGIGHRAQSTSSSVTSAFQGTCTHHFPILWSSFSGVWSFCRLPGWGADVNCLRHNARLCSNKNAEKDLHLLLQRNTWTEWGKQL